MRCIDEKKGHFIINLFISTQLHISGPGPNGARIGKLYIYVFPISAHMSKMYVNLNLTELQIIRTLADGPASMKMLAQKFKSSFSWVFKCIDNLKTIGFVQTSKSGRSSQAALSSTTLGNRLMTFLKESDYPNPELVLEGRSLCIMPLLVPDGANCSEIIELSGLSRRTVITYLGFWRDVGLLVFDRPTYRINPRHDTLIELLRAFSEHVNISIAGALGIPYAMLWQGRGEFIISVDREIDSAGFSKAADTALDDLGIDLIHRSDYYLYNPSRRKVSKAEALVQAIVIDRNEPRMARYIRKVASSNKRLRTAILFEARRYGIEEFVTEVLANART